MTERVKSRKSPGELNSDQLFHLVVEAAPIGMIVVDDSGRITLANSHSREIFGYEPDELIGKTIEELIPHKIGENHIHSRNKFLEKPQHRTVNGRQDLFALHKSGREIPVEIGLTPFQSGGKQFVLASVVDNSQHKAAEKALQESMEHYRVLAESAQDAIFLIAPDYKISYVNYQGASWFGRSPSELIGEPLSKVFPPEVDIRQTESLKQVFNDGNPYQSLNLPFGPDEKRWLNTVLTPIKNRNGTVQSILGVSRDVTAQVNTELQLKQRLNELEALYASGLALGQISDEKEIGAKIIEALEKHLDWHHAAVRVVKEDSEEVELLAFSRQHQKDDPEELNRVRSAIRKTNVGLSGWVIQHGQVVRSGNLKDDDRYYETFPDMNSGIYVPISASGRVIGCISVESEKRDAFNENDQRLLTTVTSQAGTAIENARLYKAAVRAAKRSEALYQAGQEMVRVIENPELIYGAAHCAVMQLMPAEAFVLGLLTEDKTRIEAVYLYDEGERRPNKFIGLEESISGRIIKSAESSYFPDLKPGDFHGVHFGSEKPVRSILGVPLRVGGEAIGAMLTQSYQPDAYTQDDKYLLESLAAQTAASIQNSQLFLDIKRRAQEQTALYETTRDISIQGDVNTLVKIITDRAASLLKADNGAVFLVDNENHDLVSIANTSAQFIGLHVGIDEGFIGRVAQTQSPLIVADYREWEGQSEKFLKLNFAAMLGVPMIYHGEIMGVLAVSNIHAANEQKDAQRQFKEDDIHLLELLASAAAGAVYSTRLLEQTRARGDEFKNLYEITRDVTTSGSSLDALLENIVVRAAQLLHAPRGGLYLFDPVTSTLELSYTLGFERLSGTKLKMGEGVAGKVAQTREAMMIDDYSTWEGRSKKFENQNVRAVLQAPMLYGQELIGVLALDETGESKRTFTQEDARTLSLIASAAAGTVYSTRLLEETRARAEEFKNLYEITREITTSGLSLDLLLENIVVRSAHLLHAKRGGIYLFDPITNTLELTYTLGFETSAGVRLEMGEGMAGRVALTRETMIVDRYSTWEGRSDKLKDQDFGAVLEVPIVYGQDLIGVLVLNESVTSQRKFTQDDARTLSLISSVAAGAVYSSRLFEETRRYAQHMESINALGRSLAESIDLHEIYQQLARSASELVPNPARVLVSLFKPEDSILQIVYGLEDGTQVESARLTSLSYEPSEEDTDLKMILSGKPLIIEDFRENIPGTLSDPHTNSRGDQIARSAIYLPMLAEGSVIGVLEMQSYNRSRYSQAEADLLSLAANTAAVAIQNTNLVNKLEQRVDQLSGVHAVDTAISSTTDLRMSLRTVLDNVIRLLKVDAADILLLNPANLTLEHAASRGFHSNEITRTSIRFGEGQAGQAALDRKVLHKDYSSDNVEDTFRKLLMHTEGFHAQLAAPLVAKGQIRGVLEIFNRAALNPTHEWLDFLNILTSQASLAVDSGQMFENLGRANLELTLAYDATIEGWSQALDLRDKETKGHTQRVTDLALELARRLGMEPSALVHMRRGALLHDIGKMGIPDRILLKPDKLTDDEWVIMKRHPVYAHDLLTPISYLRPALDIPYYHHEKWDGSGYPKGLKAEQIPMPARIFAVVDVYDALISDRPYRPAWTKKKALAYIREQSGEHFDPNLTAAFLNLVAESHSR